MTASSVLFDSWAWWECLHKTPQGNSLGSRFLRGKGPRVHTSAISLAEISARLAAEGLSERIESVCGAIRRASQVWDVTADIAAESGRVRAELRKIDPSASLADALVLVTARRAGARLVSADPAFRKVAGVIRE